MNSKPRCCLLLVGLSLAFSVLVYPPIATTQTSQQEAAASTQPQVLLHYSLPPDKLQKSYALSLIGGVLYFVTTAWGFLVLYGMLRARFGGRLRDLAVRASRFRVVQAGLWCPCFSWQFRLHSC